MSAPGASVALTRALVAALAGDAGLRARGPVHDAPPPGAAVPYLLVGPDLVQDWSTKTTQGREHRLRVTVVEAPLRAARCADTLGLVEAVVAGMGPTLDGHRLVSMRFVRSAVGAENAGGPMRGVAEFRARTVAL